MQLFYSSEISNNNNHFTFPQEESKHIVKVLRKTTGDVLHITNGKGLLCTAEILIADHKKCHVQITNSKQDPPYNHNIHMVVAPTKMNDRYEWFLEKATEIGVSEITPVICDHSERKVVKPERFEKVIQSAMKQSQRTYKPVLHDAITLKDFLHQDFTANKYIAHCEEDQKLELKDQPSTENNSIILIGPEGDFSTSEITLALQKGFMPTSLGNYRLRTETAAIVACTTLNLKHH